MNPNDFIKEAIDILEPFYPNAETWLEKNRQRIIDVIKLHGGRNILDAFIACINKKGKLDFFFQDITRYLPIKKVGGGLCTGEREEEYFSRLGIIGSMVKNELKPLTEKEKNEGEILLQKLKKRFGIIS